MSNQAPVQAWRETVEIPTYGVGQPNRNPMFLEKRVYQGSSGVVYPHAVVEHIEDEKQHRPWDALFLENQYLKIMVLPELGGRVQMALDKTNDYHFVYYNRVIKPALVGLAGPWVSGGIEFNWPQHHRPNTFGPVETFIAENEDGSQTIWCNEIDLMRRTKAMHGLTLHPDRAYLEVKVRLYNRTDLPQTFLWWANPAIHVDENHQSIFPPDVHAVMDHGKRDVSSFPIARGEYYKIDYSPGTDISRWKNIPVPTSYMAYHSDYDFVGSYDHGRQAGLLHVCNHHISPGKKMWTWGNGDFGKVWYDHLTDEDGPYIELMCGVYTDNQPDFTWLMPGEEKTFSQYFMPYKGLGLVHNATTDGAVKFEVDRGHALIGAYTTREQPGAQALITHGDRVLIQKTFDGSPSTWFETTESIDPALDPKQLRLSVRDADGNELVGWQPHAVNYDDIPEPAKAIDRPPELDSTESLYLAGMHLEQYRHATREPAEYYQESVQRDSHDLRSTLALGSLWLRRGRFERARPLLEKAVERATRHNPNPYDGEPFYKLGLCCEWQGEYQSAYDAYYKSTWNQAWQMAGYFALARLECRAGRWCQALTLARCAQSKEAGHQRAAALEVLLLCALGEETEAATKAWWKLEADPFNGVIHWEQASLAEDFSDFDDILHDSEKNYLELAGDYASMGLYSSAASVLEHYLDRVSEPKTAMTYYHLAYYQQHAGQEQAASKARQQAANYSSYLCFPHRLEEIAILRDAMERNPSDAGAPHYLGNLWYDKLQYNLAIPCWERAVELSPSFPTPWRNLGIAYYNKQQDAERAWNAFENAYQVDPNDARVLFELDQLAKQLGHEPQDRLERLNQSPDLVNERDDLYLEYVTLLNLLGRHREALDAVLDRTFHPWEGGEGKVPAQFVTAVTELARQALADGNPQQAIELLDQTDPWPRSLGEGKLAVTQENNVHYLRGLAHRCLGDETYAKAWLEEAATGFSEPTSPMYYNDQPPDMIFYQGLAQRELGNENAAELRFRKLYEYGREHVNDDVEIDYFAVSLPDFLIFDQDMNTRNQIHCHYIMALGALGLGNLEASQHHFDEVLSRDPNHIGVRVHQTMEGLVLERLA
jgi:tetratricopeptide (TPR) repeat protein